MNRVERLEKALQVARGFVMNLACREHLEENWSTASATLMEMDGVLNPPPAYEDVEVVRYAVFDAYGSFVATTAEEPANVDDGGTSVKLTGTYKRPLPTPVEKMTHGIAADGSVVLDIGEQPPKGTPCVVLWEEGGDVAPAKPTIKRAAVPGVDVSHVGAIVTRPFFNFAECHGKRGTLTFTWSEEDQ